jgi:hypothetical protein
LNWNGYGDAAYVMSMALTLQNEESRVNAVLVVAQEPSKLNPAEVENLRPDEHEF